MAEAVEIQGAQRVVALKSLKIWRENKKKRDAKCAENHKFANVGESIALMQNGSDFIKLRNASKKYPRTYFIDSALLNICWTPSKKGDRARIPISAIKEVREGNMSDAFSQCNEVFPEDRCFSIIHGDSFVALDIISLSREESMHWLIGLRYLMAKHLGLCPGVDEHMQRQMARDQWLREIFTTADKSGDGFLSIEEVFSLMHRINVKISNKKLRETFKAADTNTEDSEGLLDFQEFAAFYKSISTRPELYMLLIKYGNGKESLTVDELVAFLKTEQGLEEDKDYCKSVIEKHEPAEDNRVNEVLGIDGFTNFLLSADGELFNPKHYTVNQDMAKPLSHYFVASSHNTYLLGDQLTSTSSMDMYVRVLQSGCRCLELDCWDGKDGEPVVYHGYTLTSKVKFRYVILNINDFAFIGNRYPVILSIENHCGVQQQKFMAIYMKEIFKDKLIYANEYGEKDLPSPQALMGKILIKTKKLPKSLSEDLDEGEVTEEDSADELDDCFKFKSGDNETEQKMKERKCRKTLASLNRLRMNKEDDESDARGDLSSAIVSSVADDENSELTGKKKQNPKVINDMDEMGFALNYQSDGRMLQINKGRFKTNGNCGYVLKPDIMVRDDLRFDPMSRKEVATVTPKTLKIRVISGQQLPKPKDSILGDRGEIIDPYVEIEIIGIPADNAKHRTKTIEDNGFNPVWEETMTFLLRFPDIALVRFVVWDEDPIGRDFIGQYTLSFTSIMQGYRHIHLEGLDQATVFVHISISDHHGDKAIDISDNLIKEKQQSGGVKFKKRLMRNNSIM
uniref:Phosphoinositide phospholipase C n=1 Tax=Actinia tenebrosa TaxID=6105 RepID=A0A6P8JAS0_ACTTE